MKTIKLFRPVNKVELDLIQETGWKKFPPRLPEQPIFYPVTNQAYASQITTEWNLPSYKNGFVTEFELPAEYLSKFNIEKVGLDHHTELWVPAEELEEFNSQIIGDIKVVEAYHASPEKRYVLILSILDLTKTQKGILFQLINHKEDFKPSENYSLSGVQLKKLLNHASPRDPDLAMGWIGKPYKGIDISHIQPNTICELEIDKTIQK